MAKIVPSERLRREFDELVAGVGEHEDPVEAVARLGARLIMQQALEDEVTGVPRPRALPTRRRRRRCRRRLTSPRPDRLAH
jgi:hypothetical protein